MYRSNRSFNTRHKPPPRPPRQPPWSFTFSKIIVQTPPYLGQNAVQMPHIRIHSGDSFHRHVNDKRTAETPSIVEHNPYKYRKIIQIQYNKNWEALSAYLLRTKVLCKAAEITATRSLNAQLFFVCHATYKAFCKKIPPIEITTSWPFHWHASLLTLLINIHAAGESNWPLVTFLLLWIIGSPV